MESQSLSTELCRRVVILDNGLARIGDHSFAYARGLTKTLGAAGVPVAIYALREFDPELRAELDFTPHFEFSLYDYLPASGFEKYRRGAAAMMAGAGPDASPSEKRTTKELNLSYRSDLARLPSDIWEEGNIILLPGLIQHQIVGLAEFVRANAQRIAAKIIVQLMFGPDWLPWSKASQRGAAAYAKAFRMLKRQIQATVFLTTENDLLAKVYRDRFGIKTGLLPVALVGATSQPAKSGTIRLGFFGYSKVEKGFDLLPGAIDLCRKARNDLSFVIQNQHHGHEPEVDAAERALRTMPEVRLLEGSLPEETYANESAGTDVILLPYHPELFGLRGSGVFIEAVTAGRLIVASKDTWAGRSVETGEAIGETFAPHTSEALAEAILRLCQDATAKRKLALEKAAAFSAANSFEAYVRALFDITGLSPPPRSAAA